MMIILSIGLFVLALVGIVGLFTLRFFEEKNGAKHMPALRARADEYALLCKDWLETLRRDAEYLAPAAARIGRELVHEGALGFASFARMLERGAYALADRVGHKHRFVPRETRNEFLRRVSEYKAAHASIDVQQ